MPKLLSDRWRRKRRATQLSKDAFENTQWKKHGFENIFLKIHSCQLTDGGRKGKGEPLRYREPSGFCLKFLPYRNLARQSLRWPSLLYTTRGIQQA